MNLPDAFPYKGLLVCVEHEEDREFCGSFDFGDAEENAKYAKQWRDGEVLNTRITVRCIPDGDGAGEVIDCLGGVHLLNDGTVWAQVRRMIDDGELTQHSRSTRERTPMPTVKKVTKKLRGKALDKAIESAYYLLADGRQIDVMKIGAMFADARERYTNCGETVEEATSAAIARFCVPEDAS